MLLRNSFEAQLMKKQYKINQLNLHLRMFHLIFIFTLPVNFQLNQNLMSFPVMSSTLNSKIRVCDETDNATKRNLHFCCF